MLDIFWSDLIFDKYLNKVFNMWMYKMNLNRLSSIREKLLPNINGSETLRISELLTITVPIPNDEKKLTYIFIFTLLCGALEGFMKALSALKCENKNLS